LDAHAWYQIDVFIAVLIIIPKIVNLKERKLRVMFSPVTEASASNINEITRGLFF
jgi:hypothetical protein